MGKRKEWKPTITVKFIPFESEREKELHYESWVETFLDLHEHKLKAERRKQRESAQQDDPSQP